MSEVAHALLRKLLAQAERGGRETLPITERSARDYFEVRDLSGRDAIHADLANAEATGCIRLEWGRGAAAQDLIRVRLRDADRLAKWLGVPRVRESTARISDVLEPLLRDAPAWLLDAYAVAMEQWGRGRSAFRIEVMDTAGALELFRTALAVSRGEQEGLDLRRFSARLLGNSKAIERQLGRLADLLRRNPQWSALEDNRDLYRALGLEKFPPPLLLKGPLTIRLERGRLDIADITPYAGLSPDAIECLKPLGSVPYLLTVENLASFQRHVREIRDQAVVIYTAGFPGPDLIRVLRRLDQELPIQCPFFHWGDRDIGGLRIFAQLAKSLTDHTIEPHLMDALGDLDHSFGKSDRKILETFAAHADAAGNLASGWLKGDFGPLEQERVDPAVPW